MIHCAISVKHHARLFSLGSERRSDQEVAAEGGQSKSKDDCHQILVHCNSPREAVSETSLCRVFCLLRFEDWETLDVSPVRRLGRDVTAETIFLVISRYLLVRRVGFEKKPSPSITPQWIIWEAVFLIFDLDKPHFCSRSPMCITRRQLSVVRSKYLFH